jgi:hypothetical protein
MDAAVFRSFELQTQAIAEPDHETFVVAGERRCVAHHVDDAGKLVPPGCAPAKRLACCQHLVVGQFPPIALICRQHDQGRIFVANDDAVLGVDRLEQVGRAGCERR